MNLLFSNKVPKEVADVVIQRSDKMDIDPNQPMFLFDFESELDPYRENSFRCFSYTQFCPDVPGGNYKTINGTRYYFSDLKTWTPVQLMNLSFDYIEEQLNIHGKPASYYDLYFDILWPAAVGKPDDYVLNTQSNPIFDLNKDGKITVGEVKQYLDNRVREKVPQGYWDIFFKKKTSSGCIEKKSLYGELLLS